MTPAQTDSLELLNGTRSRGGGVRTFAACPIEDEHDDAFEEDTAVVLEEQGEVSNAPAAPVQLKPL